MFIWQNTFSVSDFEIFDTLSPRCAVNLYSFRIWHLCVCADICMTWRPQEPRNWFSHAGSQGRNLVHKHIVLSSGRGSLTPRTQAGSLPLSARPERKAFTIYQLEKGTLWGVTVGDISFSSGLSSMQTIHRSLEFIKISLTKSYFTLRI